MTGPSESRQAALRSLSEPGTQRALAIVFPSLEARAAYATPGEIGAILAREAPHFGIGGRSSGEYREMFGSYVEALSNLPLEAIEVAFVRWNRAELYPTEPGRHAFFPRAAEIHALAKDRKAELLKAVERAREAMRGAAPTRVPRSAEERAEVQRMLADFNATMASRRPRDWTGPAVSRADVSAQLRQLAERERAKAPTYDFGKSQGAVDSGGITPEMRKFMRLPPALEVREVVELDSEPVEEEAI